MWNGNKDCQHLNKSWSPMMYATNPPQCDWICRDCGKEGCETIGKIEINDYYDMRQKFKK